MKILLTGDDGYNSLGTRLLVRLLKSDHELLIAGTKDQQSGVGGHLSVKEGGTWGETKVDGVPAIWCSGYPSDVLECVAGLGRKNFDLVLSGINWGANVSGSGISSGTFAAAIRAMDLGLASKALAISWMVPSEFWFKSHDGNQDISIYLKHPGETAVNIINLALKRNFWGAQILNINLPEQATDKILVTKPLPNILEYFPYVIMDESSHTFRYPLSLHENPRRDVMYDTGAILGGYISVTPCQVNFLDDKIFKKMKKLSLKLE